MHRLDPSLPNNLNSNFLSAPPFVAIAISCRIYISCCNILIEWHMLNTTVRHMRRNRCLTTRDVYALRIFVFAFKYECLTNYSGDKRACIRYARVRSSTCVRAHRHLYAQLVVHLQGVGTFTYILYNVCRSENV